jgi:hypothetical protein
MTLFERQNASVNKIDVERLLHRLTFSAAYTDAARPRFKGGAPPCNSGLLIRARRYGAGAAGASEAIRAKVS